MTPRGGHELTSSATRTPSRYRGRIAALAALVLLACVDEAPMKPKVRDVSARQAPILLTNFLSGPGTWNWRVNHINGSHVWYMFAYYANGDTVRYDGSSGGGALRPLAPLETVRLEAVWCFSPIGQDHNLCDYSILDQDTGPYTDQVVGWDEPDPYYIGPGDDFIVEFTLPSTAPKLTLTVDHSKLIIGETATFTATLDNGSIPHVTSWSFQSAPVIDCGTDSFCNFPVPTSGTMTVTATVSGQSASASVAVVASPLDCPTLDPFLDNPIVRRALVDAVNAGQGLNPDFAKWKEFDFGLVESPNLVSQPLQMLPGADQCSSDFAYPKPSDYPGVKFRAIIHVHPGTPNHDNHCVSNPGELQTYASGKDLKIIKQMGTDPEYMAAGWTAPWLVIDNWYVYKYSVDANGDIQRQSWSWNKDGCNWNQF
jgi:hypothetical protein